MIMWFRRDLRLADNPALHAAIDESASSRNQQIIALFVLDPRLYGPAGLARRSYLAKSLRALDSSLGGALTIRHGDPVTVVPQLAQAVGSRSVHITGDFGPYGRLRDTAVRERLKGAGAQLITTGSNYAAPPRSIRKPDGQPYRVFTPFYRRWLDHIESVVPTRDNFADWLRCSDSDIDLSPLADLGLSPTVPTAGEQAAHNRWAQFLANDVAHYAQTRNIPGADRSSKISVHLKWGELHPRTLLIDLASGWMHNRLRMLTASFLVKDLHLDWRVGAR